MLSYQLIRSDKRKTVGLQVKHGKVIIRAPKYISDNDVARIVSAKSAWLQRKLTEQSERAISENHYYQENSDILIYGERKKLHLNFGVFTEVHLEKENITVTLSNRIKTKIAKTVVNTSSQQSKQVKNLLDTWLKQQTTAYIDLKVSEFAEQIGVIPKLFKVRLYKSRWGSCNSKQELSFSSLLAMTPHWVIDYVIVHELCHIVHMNHSKAFWQLVAQHFPNYKLAKTWLKTHQSQLQWPKV